ncbi:MAG: hypothetical protein ABI333_01145 [bacterium]
MQQRPRSVLRIALPADVRGRVSLTVHQPVPALFEEQSLPLWVACPWDERPPTGLAGRCDWRLRGLLSRGLQQERLSLGFGDVALVGAFQRLRGASLVLFGMGVAAACDAARLLEAARRTADLVRDLGCTRYALEAPCPEGELPTRFLVEHIRRRLADAGGALTLEVTLVMASAAVVATAVTNGKKIAEDFGTAQGSVPSVSLAKCRNLSRLNRRRAGEGVRRRRYRKISSRASRSGPS